MKSRLRLRLERLERQSCAAATITQSGYVVQLPHDFVGDRHVVLVDRRPTDSPNEEWCVFEERPGPGPNEAGGAHVMYLSEADMRI
jgi:hypothetical protein